MNLQSSTLPKGKIFPKSCTICGVHFKSARHFTVHSQRKNICRPKPYTCRKCGKVFNYYWNLIAHEKRKYPCGLKVSKIKRKIASSVQAENCNIVAEYLYEEKPMSINVSSLKKLMLLTCQKCGESFRSHSSYYRHRKKCPLNQFHNIDISQNKIYSCKPKTETSLTFTESYEIENNGPSHSSEQFQDMLQPTSIPEKQIHSLSNESDKKASDMFDVVIKPNNTFSEQESSLASSKTCTILENEKDNTKKDVNVKLEKDKYEFACEVCSYVCFNVYTWCKHMKKHKSIKISTGFLRCPVCNETFSTPYILFRHQRKLKHWRQIQKISNQYKNDDKEMTSLIKQIANISKDKTNSNSSSIVNNIDSSNSNIDESRRKSMPNERPLSMKLRDIAQIKKKKWNKIRIKKINKAINVQSNKGSRKYPDKCPICGKFVTLLSSCHHFQNKPEYLPFVCKWCSRCFKYFRELTCHEQMKHRDLLPFECIQCKQRFSKRSCTLSHISQLHKDVPKMSLVKECTKAKVCSLLDKNSATQFQIQETNSSSDKHLSTNKSHTLQELVCNKTSDCGKKGSPCGNDPSNYCFVCSVCNQVFDNVTVYVAHSLNHFNSNQIDPSEISESKPYECEICMQKFNHHQRVQAHFLWHLKMIKSPFSESANNTSNIIFSLYNTKDNVHAKARFQIAKKSIFTKMAFSNSLSENRFHGYDIYSETPCNKCSYVNCHCQDDCSSNRICFCLQNYRSDSNCADDQKLEMLDCNNKTPKKCVQYRENSHIELHNYCQVHNDQKESLVQKLSSDDKATETKEENCISQEPSKELVLQNTENICHDTNKHLTNDYTVDDHNKDIIEFNLEGKKKSNKKNSCCNQHIQTPLASVEKSQFSYSDNSCENHKSLLHSLGDEIETVNKEQTKKNYSKINKLKCGSVCYSYSTLAEIAKLSHTSGNTCFVSAESDSVIPENIDPIKSLCILRNNFSELLYLLIGDPELMQVLGWGEKEIDVILEEVLCLLGQTPIEANVKLEKLRLNISLLLQICIKDSVVDGLKSNSSTVDDVVLNILQLCKSGIDDWSELNLFNSQS